MEFLKFQVFWKLLTFFWVLSPNFEVLLRHQFLTDFFGFGLKT